MMNEKEISDLIYSRLDYMYCDNCRHNFEETESDPCYDCFRKYNNWGVSRAEADKIAAAICKG